jgi:malonyl-CoA/methylmalonyl-CoA synthetase
MLSFSITIILYYYSTTNHNHNHNVDDSKNPEEYAMLQRLGVQLVHVPSLLASLKSSTTTTTTRTGKVDGHHQDGALVLYTSGTTGRPKGVLHTRAGLESAIQALAQSWEYSDKDRILHFLPLHHLHGVLNKLLCIMWAGGTIEFAKSANTIQIWKRLAKDTGNDMLTVFMAVPTVYARMLEDVRKMKTNEKMNEVTNALSPSEVERAVVAMKKMRLMACGSAALPDPIMDQWLTLSGHVLLERYGMTEIGMALSNPYKGLRRKGYVGTPLPFVECRIVGDDEKEISTPEQPGELRVRGPNVFNRYLNKQDATRESFDKEGWFKTGDTAVFIVDKTINEKKEKIYKLLGRSSTDIIKSGGYKLSALEIERELLAHPQIAEAAVIVKKDDVYGEVVVAFITLRSSIDDNVSFEKELLIDPTISNSKNTLEKMRKFLDSRLATYKQPRVYHIVPSIPRNHLGKVNKKSLSKDLGFE